MIKNFFVILVLLVSVTMLGCIGPAPPVEMNQTNQTNESAEMEKNPDFAISSPINNEVITTTGETTDIELSLSTTNLVLKQPGGKAKKGEGHFQVTLDNQPMLRIATKNYVFKNVSLGNHTLKVELVNNDYSSYSPKILRTVYFTVQKEAASQPRTFEVSIADFSYNPPEITIAVGDSIKWKNNGKFPRSVTASDQTFNSILAAGTEFTFTFTKPGVYEYTSTNWPAMHGKIIVKER